MQIKPYLDARIRTERLILTRPDSADAQDLLAYHLDNRLHLQPWEPLRPDDFHTLQATENRLSEAETRMKAGHAIHFLIRLAASRALIGECQFTNIVRGPFQACHLGFSLASASQGQGLMHEALAAAIPLVFQQGLHRIMAAYRKENRRSGRLLHRLGFEIEGEARSYLKINGAWTDHVLTSRISDT